MKVNGEKEEERIRRLTYAAEERVAQRLHEQALVEAVHLGRVVEQVGDDADGVHEHAAASALARRGPALLVVKEHAHGNGRQRGQGSVNINLGAEALVRRAQVVQAAGEDELVVGSPEGRGLNVDELHLHVLDAQGVDSRGLGHEVQEHGMQARPRCFTLLGRGLEAHEPRGHGQNGLGVLLQVGLEGIGSVQVDGQIWDPRNGLVDAHELRVQAARRLVAHEHAPCHTQVTVKPRVPEAPAVRLRVEHERITLDEARHGLDFEAG